MSRFGELEAIVMDHMWKAHDARSVRDIVQELQQERQIAYTTVMTVMERLFRKGLLTRTEHDRAYLYTAAQPRSEYTAGLMAETLASSTDRAATLVRFAELVSPREAEQLLRALSDRGLR